MNYVDYCKKNKLSETSAQSAKMFYYYKEASTASTDFKNELAVEDFMKAKKALQAANVPMSNFIVQPNCIVQTDYFSFGDCVTATPTPCYPAECNKSDLESYIRPNKQKGNNPMYVDNDKHIESSKINYLTDRAATARYAAQDKIEVTFNLRKPKAPETPEELVTAITSGNYTIPPKTERNTYDRVMNQIVWRAPTVVADQTGADAAHKVFDTLYKSAQDAIMISTPAEALTAVQALDAWTPVAGTVAS